MDAIDAILTRRSIRRFTDQPVSGELIEQLILAALSAPSAHNEQPWHFIVIDDRAVLDEIPNIHPYSQMIKQAPLAICVCGDLNLEKDPGSGYWIQDCSAATQNILIAANALHLGACWLGIHPRTERKVAFQKLLNLPENIAPFSLIALGHTGGETKSPMKRDNPQRVHQNRW